VEKKLKKRKKTQKRDLNKNVKNVYYICGVHKLCCSISQW